MSLLWINGELVDKAVARVSPFDHGFLYGDGVWEPLRVFRGQLFRPAEHIASLFRSAGVLGLAVPLSETELTAAIETTVRANNRTEGYVRVIVSRGPGTIGPDPRKLDAQVYITAEEYLPFPAELYGHGLHVVTTEFPADRADPTSASRVLGQPHVVLAKRHALRAGCLDAVLLDPTGQAMGTTEGGLHVVRAGAVHPIRPAPTDVTWEAVRDLVRAEPASDASRGDLLAADEVFLAGTSCGVIGVVRVDGHDIGTGTEGPVTRQIREAYRRLTRGE